MLSHSIALYKNLQKRYSRKINLDLNRINTVLKKLNNPHLDLINPINILGSDGKMSVLTCLKYFLQSDKKKITAFTSPHLYDLRQRIWLNNNYISLINLKKLIKSVEQTKLKLTLFELLTCVYILAAKDQKNIHYHLIVIQAIVPHALFNLNLLINPGLGSIDNGKVQNIAKI